MKYRKKPVVVEAYKTDKEFIIHTLEGDMKASVGDYIITGVNGEQYPCKPDIFEKTYEAVTNTNEVEKKIVLCKDCKFNHLVQPGGIIHCGRESTCGIGTVFRKADDYCSYGEKRVIMMCKYQRRFKKDKRYIYCTKRKCVYRKRIYWYDKGACYTGCPYYHHSPIRSFFEYLFSRD